VSLVQARQISHVPQDIRCPTAEEFLRDLHTWIQLWRHPSPLSAGHATIVAYLVNVYSRYGFNVPLRHQVEAICEQIALKLKEEREQRGLSLNSLSEKAGLSRQTVAFIEQGLRTPTVATLLRLTLAMNIELEKLIADARHNASAKKQKR
jgi:DNA-binding XRE family transcriptional regulator